MVASAASEVGLETHAVLKASKSTPQKGIAWIIAAVCIAAWSADAVLAWTATQVLAPVTVQASDIETTTQAFTLSRWRNVALEAQGPPGTHLVGSLVRLDGTQETPFKVTVRNAGKTTTVLPAPEVGGEHVLRLHAEGGDAAGQVAVHQGKPHAQTAWLFYGFNLAAMLIFIAWRGIERWRVADMSPQV